MSVATIVIAAVALALAAYLVIRREQVRAAARSTSDFVGEVNGEVRKVTWPDRQQLRQMTGVIIIFVIAVAILIGLMDIILQSILVKWLPALVR